jgi:hypothetical protein
VTYAEYRERVERLTPEQARRIRAKCQREHCSWLGVATDWPELFEVEGMARATPYRSEPDAEVVVP